MNTTVADQLRHLAAEVAAAVLESIAQTASESRSLGLLDGEKIVNQYIDVNELALAYDHLMYMLDEGDARVSIECRRRLHELAQSIGVPRNCSD